MSIDNPWALVVGLLVVAAVAAGLVVLGRRRRRALARAGITTTGRGGRVGAWLSVAGLAVLVLAAAGPVAKIPVPRTAGTVVVAVDVSNSMAATDADPTRLGAAQQAAEKFVEAQPSSVDVGVVAFQQGALTTAQPSDDHAAAVAAIERLKVAGSTSIGDAIITSLSAITGETVQLAEDGTAPDLGYWPSATIVLFSDGQNQGGTDAETAAAVAQTAGVHIETVGVGTTAGTSVEVDGYRVHTALDEDTLTTVAQTSGGSYHPASDASELDGIADTIDLRLTVADKPVPLAGALSVLALVLLGVGALLTVVRTGRIV
ncbi:VWA domain-containing protein [Cellulomonas sp. JH27-2]|uniref:VWA domain-containing protein n=1 Tax=Cellulomonas sp. JH27-2 TaxID=2774139 RepID=UPI00177B0CB0|nr:VWA domain-containing protein [Cellulomonas sp. JH27-2]MBD8057976.1 VWA domain-containing protein [Cellulomonas sp. JH27-2]